MLDTQLVFCRAWSLPKGGIQFVVTTSALAILSAGYFIDGHLTHKLGRPPLETLNEGRSEKESECWSNMLINMNIRYVSVYEYIYIYVYTIAILL